MTKPTAALISAIGHPFVLLPLTFAWLAVREVGFEKAWPALAAVLGCIAVMVAYIFFKKRKGLVSNWDVSAQHQRSRNVYQPILILLLVVATALYFFRQPFVADTLFFGLLMGVCYAINSRVKISQHTIIAFFVSFLVFPAHVWVGAALLAFAPFVAWSRVVLGRHQKNEVVLGAIVGTLFGLLHIWLF